MQDITIMVVDDESRMRKLIKDFLIKEDYKVIRLQDIYNQATIKIDSADTARLLKTLCNYDVKFISEIPYTLERHFKEILKARREEVKNVQ